MDSVSLGKIIIVFGLFIVLLGVFVLLAGKIPFFGKLPGDIHIQRPGFRFHFPIVTCLVLSILLTIVLNILFRR